MGKYRSIFTAVVTIASFYITMPVWTSPTLAQSGNTITADVVVVGAGSGGIAAALQAARLGAKVVLLEETDYIGGQITAAGVTSMDGNNSWRYGIYKEYTDKVIAHYQNIGKSVSTCYWSASTICFEPKVGKNIFETMLSAEPNITLIKRTGVTSIDKSADKISGLTTSQGQRINTTIVIDATEYGDVIMLTEPNYRSGNGTKQNPKTDACLQDITYLAVMKKYPQGVPTNLKFNTPPPGYSDDIKQMFRQVVSVSGNATWTGSYPVNWLVHNAYRGMPDSNNPNNYDAGNPNNYGNITKTGINWANDYPRNAYVTSNPVFLSSRYLTDKTYRKQINCEAKLRTMQFMYYVQTELGQSDWAIANDEGYDTPYNTSENSCANIPQELKTIESHLPVMPYVRESARGIGSMTLTGKDIKRSGQPPVAQTTYSSSIAIGDYPNDLHNCSDNQHLEQELENTDDRSSGGPFQVPIETLYSNTTKGLLFAEKNISVSRLVNGATRLQPITMLTGQAAGALAALTALHDTTPEKIAPIAIQKILLAEESPLFPYLDLKPEISNFGAGQLLSAAGIMSGYNPLTFGPNDALSRAQAAVVLLKAKHSPTYNPPSPTSQRFTDVNENHWAYAWIDALATAGITSGCGTDTYCPDAPVTRAQFAILLTKTLMGTAFSPPAASGVFSDVPVSHFAASWIEYLKSQNIVSGCSASTFCPNDSITRLQTAILINKAFPHLTNTILLDEVAPTPTPTPDHPGDFIVNGVVDIFDYNEVISKFGNPYTIFDYNLVISNYGN